MSLWNKVGQWWKSFKQKYQSFDVVDNPIQQASKANSVKECTRDKATIARVARAFKQQTQAMQARALKPHDPLCEDPLTCTKKICFIKEPDKIVNRTIVSESDRRKQYVKRTRMKRSMKNV